MKIVILAGGTGSIALQQGLHEFFDGIVKEPDIKVLINAYDSGLSTGQVRQVMGGQILGPSDLRKNQTTALRLRDNESPWLSFLDVRFTKESTAVEQFCRENIYGLRERLLDHHSARHSKDLAEAVNFKVQLVHEAVHEYFKSPLATKIDYTDFSLANIIYAGFARANGNSLRAAGTIMARLMDIPDNVILNDDHSLFLGAVTKSGKRITDEGEIVSWGQVDDPFIDVFFTDAAGKDSHPHLCAEAHHALAEADLIILSSGTQWSSLIPTYASLGFKRALEDSKARIVMVMNRQPDKDSPGQSASDLIKLLVPAYIPPKRLLVALDSTGHELMNHLDAAASSKIEGFGLFNMRFLPNEDAGRTRVHCPRSLTRAVMELYFGAGSLDAQHYVFDYDDTLVGRGNTFPMASEFNRRAISELNVSPRTKMSICTGNSIKAINLRGLSARCDENFNPVYESLVIYADGGVNKYSYPTAPALGDDGAEPAQLLECVNPLATIGGNGINPDHLVDLLKQHGVPGSKIENRGGAIIAIKPIMEEYRSMLVELVKLILNSPMVPYNSDHLVVAPKGRTTVEISAANLSKRDALLDVKKTATRAIYGVVYVGDEVESGNDAAVLGIEGVKVIRVKSPEDTAIFLRTLQGYQQELQRRELALLVREKLAREEEEKIMEKSE